MKVPDSRIASCGDISCEFLVDPIPRPKGPYFAVRTRPNRPVVVFVNHGKPNSREIIVRAQQLLRERGVEVQDEIVDKLSPAVPVDDEMIDRLVATEGLILCGVSD